MKSSYQKHRTDTGTFQYLSGEAFEVKLNEPAYTIGQVMEEEKAAMAMEGMKLSKEETQMLRNYTEGKASGDELRKMIFDSVTPADHGETPEAV